MALQIFFQRCTVNDLWNDVDKNVVHMIGTCHFCVIENFGRCSTPLKNDFWTHDFQNKCRRSNVEKYQTDFLKTRFKVWKGCSKNFHLAIRKKKSLKFVEKKNLHLVLTPEPHSRDQNPVLFWRSSERFKKTGSNYVPTRNFFLK